MPPAAGGVRHRRRGPGARHAPGPVGAVAARASSPAVRSRGRGGGRGRVVPESFTRGTSEQRVYGFRRGMAQGTVQACDTFREGASGGR
ncbi:neutral zinc metallopeptidase [Myxococcus sp. RHST-1-4]|nr:neutral zinc metallopeptidase [Myxococcus sp. RHSTA-1-4]MBZ4416857.1 neutral zinc metallopeptidase [Myxococcus sp. RHSTA-1-4]